MNDESLIWEAYKNYLENPLDRVMFPDSKRQETVGEFIERHDLEMKDGYIILYHGIPKKTQILGGVIRAWSYYAKTPIESIHYSTRDRGLVPQSISVYKVRILPEELEYSGFFQTNKDINLKERAELLKLSDISKQYLIDNGFLDNNNNLPEVNKNGTISLYHNTKSEELVNLIIKTKNWKSKEGNRIYFSTKPNIETTGYGSFTLKINVNPTIMNLDDIFDKEIHVWIDSKDLKNIPVHFYK